MYGLMVPQVYEYETLIHKSQNLPVCVFYLNASRPILNNDLPLLHAHEVNGFNGTIVATSLDTHFYLNRATRKGKNIFYVRTLEWLEKEDYYENQVDNYTNPNTIYVASSDYIARELDICWGTQAQVIREIEFEKIYDI